LKNYLALTNGDLAQAITLYEKNMRLAEAFYSPLQCLEVTMRNKLYVQLSNVYGAQWFRYGMAPLDIDSRQSVTEAQDALAGTNYAPGDVVAKLRFAFWVGLIGKRYDGTLWRKALYRAFLAGGGRPRKEVHGRFNAIRRFRNRVAHHEPIFNRPVAQFHAEIIEATRWMCPHTAAWSLHHSRFATVFASG
jgi:hypothetical protein